MHTEIKCQTCLRHLWLTAQVKRMEYTIHIIMTFLIPVIGQRGSMTTPNPYFLVTPTDSDYHGALLFSNVYQSVICCTIKNPQSSVHIHFLNYWAHYSNVYHGILLIHCSCGGFVNDFISLFPQKQEK